MASARHRRHRVRSGDTLPKIALHYYGAAWKQVYLKTHNALSSSDLRSVRSLELPRSYLYTAQPGDSFASIAKRRLFDVDRFSILIRFNGFKSGVTELKVGTSLLMPFHLFHVVQPGESLAAISQTYYRTSKLARTLREYNKLDSNTLDIGQKLVVPIFDRSSVELGQKPMAPAPNPPRPVTPPRSARNTGHPPDRSSRHEETDVPAELRSIIRIYDAGRFDEACAKIERLRNRKANPPKNRNYILRYAAFCAIANGEPDLARRYFREWLHGDPAAQLDRRVTSPKILEVFDDARTQASRDKIPTD